MLRQILDDEQWLKLTKDFYANHRCRTPHFSEIPEEFLEYLQNRNRPEDYPFLLELAHYEWVEMALSISKAQAQVGDGAFVQAVAERRIALSPLAWPLAYQYPVQQISPSFLPSSAAGQPVYLIVYRDQQDSVHFMQSTALIYRLLQLLEQQGTIMSKACLQLLLAEVPGFDEGLLIDEGLKTLQDMAAKGIVIPASDA